MKIAYNPESANALTAAPSNNDITFDLAGKAIYAKGVKFEGMNTTYSVFKKHTSDNSGGYDGLVPVPSYTTTTIRYLREDGNWEVPIMSEAVTDLGTDGDHVIWTKNGVVNDLTVPYASTAALLAKQGGTSTSTSIWNPQTSWTKVWGQSFTDSSISSDTGDILYYLRAGEYSPKNTELCVTIDGDYYAGTGQYKVWHAGNLTKVSQLDNDSGFLTSLPSHSHSYLPLAGGKMDSTAFISWNDGADGNDVSDWSITDNGLRIISSVSTDAKAPTRYSTALHVKGRYGFQLASAGGAASNSFYIKNVHNTVWNSLIHSGNISSQSVNYAASAGNADKLDNLHSYAFKKTWEAYAGKTYVGWVTIAKWTVTTASHFSPQPFMLSIYRSYNSPASESYTFSITFGWDTATITQVSGNAKDRIIEKLRIGKCSDNLTYKLEMYVNTAYTTYDNTCHCVAYGYCGDNFSATTTCALTSNVSSTLAEISASSGNIVGNLVGNATTAETINGFTKRGTASCTWGTLTASNEYTPVYWGDTASGGGIGYSDKGGKTYMQIDGDYYAQEGTKLVLHTGNSAVSGGGSSWGSSITVNIGGTSKTLTIPSNPNTWRGITDSYSGTDSTISLSQKGGNALYNALVNGYATSAGIANYLTIHDIRDNNYAPNSTSWPLFNIRAWFNNTGTPDGDWWSGITVKGWTNDYNVWLLASTATNHSYANFGLFFRTGNGSSWTNWKNVVTSESVNNIVVTSSLPATKVNNTIYILV